MNESAFLNICIIEGMVKDTLKANPLPPLSGVTMQFLTAW